jgi:hypothetical protein
MQLAEPSVQSGLVLLTLSQAGTQGRRHARGPSEALIK